jgi:hypothetical protein
LPQIGLAGFLGSLYVMAIGESGEADHPADFSFLENINFACQFPDRVSTRLSTSAGLPPHYTNGGCAMMLRILIPSSLSKGYHDMSDFVATEKIVGADP